MTKTIRTLELEALAPLERVLAAGDGALADMLEAVALEGISAIALTQNYTFAPGRLDGLDLDAGEPLVDRRVVLCGTETGAAYAYAESLVAWDRLDEAVREEWLSSGKPFSRIRKAHRLESFREILHLARKPAAHVAAHLGIGSHSMLLVRTSRLFTGGRPVMLSTEYLPPVVARAGNPLAYRGN